jgi:hypothetical protein
MDRSALMCRVPANTRRRGRIQNVPPAGRSDDELRIAGRDKRKLSRAWLMLDRFKALKGVRGGGTVVHHSVRAGPSRPWGASPTSGLPDGLDEATQLRPTPSFANAGDNRVRRGPLFSFASAG